MNREEVMNFIDSSKKFGSRPGLLRIKKLCELLGNPQDKIKFIHIAGTNGKGSTSLYIHNFLSDAGHKTGLYTSPFIYEFNERIQINGESIPDDELVKIMSVVAEKVDIMTHQGYEHPTEFELITAAAFLYFEREKCDIVVLEVGLGGTFDATNIIKKPVLSVITSISLDHTDYLGNTLAEVSKNKCGIIKEGAPVISYIYQPEEALDVIEKTAKEKKVPFKIVADESLEINSMSLLGSDFTYCGEKYHTSLVGKYQIYNALTAILAREQLFNMGFNVSLQNVKNGLLEAKWPARFEILKTMPTVIADGSHNADGMNAFVETAKAVLSDKPICVFGMLKDKDYEHCIKKLSEITDTVVVTEVDSPRRETVEKLSHTARKYIKNVYEEKENKDAIKKALELVKKDGTVIALGSLYMMKNIKDAIKKQDH